MKYLQTLTLVFFASILFSNTMAQQSLLTSNKSTEVLLNNVSFSKAVTNNHCLAIGVGEDMVRVIWQTTIEVNTSLFELQRSSNGNEFETIKIVKAGKNKKTKTNYEAIFNNMLISGNKTVYRLKLVFEDGSAVLTEQTAFTMVNPNGQGGYVVIK